MLDFTSIKSNLQARIAEKIDFFDQRAFESASKCGRNAMLLTKHKAVVDVLEIRRSEIDKLTMFLKHFPSGRSWKTCDELCRVAHLPRFKVSKLRITSTASLDSLKELYQMQCFVASDLYLDWRLGSDTVFTALDVLLELFNVTDLKLHALGSIDENLVSSQKFRKIRSCIFDSVEIPTDKLLQLQASRITLYRQPRQNFFVTTNLFFKQWFTKNRNIEWMRIQTDLTDWYQQRKLFSKENVFSDLPYSIIHKHGNRLKYSEFKLLMAYHSDHPIQPPCERKWFLDEVLLVCSIDRGDKKLLVFIVKVSRKNICLFAQECTDLDEVIWMKNELRKLVDFSRLFPHIQLRIAKKMDFSGQQEFELSSQCGKHIVRYTKPMIEVKRCQNYYRKVSMYIEGKYWKSCQELCQISNLPLIKISNLDIYEDDSLDFLIELCTRQCFIASKVSLEWSSTSGHGVDFSSLSTLLKLFNVETLFLRASCSSDDDVFSLLKASEIHTFTFDSIEIPDEQLLQLQASRISFKRQNKKDIFVTTNLFFKQWYTKKRIIEWMEVEISLPGSRNYTDDPNRFKKENVFEGLPYTIIWEEGDSRIDENYFIFFTLLNPHSTLYSPSYSNNKLKWCMQDVVIASFRPWPKTG